MQIAPVLEAVYGEMRFITTNAGENTVEKPLWLTYTGVRRRRQLTVMANVYTWEQ
jgi:hypothetical protein